MKLSFLNLRILVGLLCLYIAYEGILLLFGLFFIGHIDDPREVLLPVARSAIAGAIAFHLWTGSRSALRFFLFGCATSVLVSLFIIYAVIQPTDSLVFVLFVFAFLIFSMIGFLLGIFNPRLRAEMEERRSLYEAERADRIARLAE